MEINGKEITSGENGTIEIKGIKLEWLIEYVATMILPIEDLEEFEVY